MDGFNEDDTIPSFNASELIEEVEDESEDNDEGQVDSEENDEDDKSSLDSYEGVYRATKRFKKTTSDENVFKVKVYETLQKSCKVFGDFAVSGKLECTPLIVLSLKKSGDSNVRECIKFPLHEQEISKIIELFDQSPYGKGTETIVDTSVRNSYQLRPESFEILNSDWDKFMKTVVVDQIKKDMSLDCSFVPSLHRLLLYTSGSFFKPHRDSEKEDNMFGTLVVQLPSNFKGGQLVVRHDGKTKVFDLSSSDSVNNSFCTFFSAFYCDCEHEILPVTEGYRMCLIYNLIATDTDIPLAPRNHSLEMELVALLQNWKNSRKLVYALSHKYSQSNLSLKNLKTSDKTVANILKSISTACDLNIYLALLEKDCSGYGSGYENEYSCRGCTSDFDEDKSDNEISYQLTDFISFGSNEKMTLSKLDVDFNEEVIPDHCFDRVKPYDADCDHTGNEGVQINKSYRCAAIVFWPKKITVSVLLNSDAPKDLVVSLFLEEAENYFKADCKEETKIKIEDWATSIVADQHFKSSKENSIAIVNTIVKFNNVGLIPNLIRHVMVEVPGETLPLMIAACEKYGWEPFSTSIVDMFKHISRKDAITNLTQMLGYENIGNQKQILLAILEAIHGIRDWSRSYFVSDENKIKQTKEDNDILEPLVNAMIRLNDLDLLKKLINCVFTLNPDTVLPLSTMCEKFGWEPFATLVADKFGKLSKNDAVKYLTTLIQNGLLNEDKKKLCLSLFGITMNKKVDFNQERFYSYQRVNSAAEILKKKKDEKELLEPFINAAVKFNNLELLQNLFQRVVPLHSETIPLLINQCKTFGWNAFTSIFLKMFETLSQKDAIESLSLLIQSGNLNEDKKSFFDLFQMVLEKPTIQSNALLAMSQDDRKKHFIEEQDVLYSICVMAEKIKFNLLSFAKTKSFKDFVPVLLRLVPKGASSLNTFWGAIAFHFISEMGKESVKVIEASWRRGTNLVNVCCKDCVALNNFLQSNKESETFKMGEKRRKHIQQRISLMHKIAHRTEHGERIGALIVTKTEMSGAAALKIRNLSQSLLARLRAVMPYNS